MIRYTLKCANAHSFESWFQSATSYDELAERGLVTCAVCGSTEIEKSLMAPSTSTGAKERLPASEPSSSYSLSAPKSAVEAALAAFREKLEAHSENVGRNFAREARAIHDGEAPERAIHGEARADEARALVEDGIPVAPLPFLPKSRTN